MADALTSLSRVFFCRLPHRQEAVPSTQKNTAKPLGPPVKCRIPTPAAYPASYAALCEDNGLGAFGGLNMKIKAATAHNPPIPINTRPSRFLNRDRKSTRLNSSHL